MEIYAVKINGLDHPMGFDFEHLLCSWKVRNNKGKITCLQQLVEIGNGECSNQI